MIKKIFFLLSLLFLISCGNIELILSKNSVSSPLIGNTSLIFDGIKKEELSQELISVFENKKDSDFILITSFEEKKENRLVKKNQVAEKIDYQIIVDYKIFYKKSDCKIFNKTVVTRFSFVPKSFGYNFGTDVSLQKLYKTSIKKNIQQFISLAAKNKTSDCIK